MSWGESQLLPRPVLTCMTGMTGPIWNISDAGDDGGCFTGPTECGSDTEAIGVEASLPC